MYEFIARSISRSHAATSSAFLLLPRVRLYTGGACFLLGLVEVSAEPGEEDEEDTVKHEEDVGIDPDDDEGSDGIVKGCCSGHRGSR